MQRIAKDELGLELNSKPKFIGIFEHFYEDGIFEGVSTHYINLVYEVEVSSINPTKEQHSGYKWFDKKELLQSDEVHKYTKDCFKIGEKENE